MALTPTRGHEVERDSTVGSRTSHPRTCRRRPFVGASTSLLLSARDGSLLFHWDGDAHLKSDSTAATSCSTPSCRGRSSALMASAQPSRSPMTSRSAELSTSARPSLASPVPAPRGATRSSRVTRGARRPRHRDAGLEPRCRGDGPAAPLGGQFSPLRGCADGWQPRADPTLVPADLPAPGAPSQRGATLTSMQPAQSEAKRRRPRGGNLATRLLQQRDLGISARLSRSA